VLCLFTRPIVTLPAANQVDDLARGALSAIAGGNLAWERFDPLVRAGLQSFAGEMPATAEPSVLHRRRRRVYTDLLAQLYRCEISGGRADVFAAADDSARLVLFASMRTSSDPAPAAIYEDADDYAWSTLVGLASLIRLQGVLSTAERGFGLYESPGDAAATMALQVERDLWERLGPERDAVLERLAAIARDEYRLTRSDESRKDVLLVAIVEAPPSREEDDVLYIEPARALDDWSILARRVVGTG